MLRDNIFNIKTIEINNFHCYQKEVFEFAKQITVFIGKNGSGKSSLVKAIKNSLSIYFCNNSKWGKGSLVGSVSDLTTSNLNIREIWHDEKMKYADGVDIKTKAYYFPNLLPEWSFRKLSKDKAKLQQTPYEEAFISFMDRYANLNILPLFAYYSDRFPHVGTVLKNNIKTMIDNDDILDRSWGYYHWDYDTSCAEIWQKRFIRIFKLHANYVQIYNDEFDRESAYAEGIKKSIQKYADELNYIREYLRRFSNSKFNDKTDELQIKNLIVDGISEPYIVTIFENGKRIRWDELPAGYERMFNMVFDIAYRSYILNGAANEANGVVIIDELDLHLHPSMERTILQRLKETFPFIQFIVTTHSPLVITNFNQDNDNKLYQLLFDNENNTYSKQEIANLFGLDYNTGLSEVMDTPPSDKEFENIKDLYQYWKNKDAKKADEIAKMIKNQYSKYDKFIQSLNI